MKLCAVCSRPQAGHAPCAICQATNAHTRLCDSCAADPANDGWCDTWEELGTEEDIAGARTQLSAVLSWWDLQDRRLRVTPLQTRILELVLHTEVERYQRRDRWGRSKGWATRERALSSKEIAHALGCDHGYVRRIRGRYLRYVNRVLEEK